MNSYSFVNLYRIVQLGNNHEIISNYSVLCTTSLLRLIYIVLSIHFNVLNYIEIKGKPYGYLDNRLVGWWLIYWRLSHQLDDFCQPILGWSKHPLLLFQFHTDVTNLLHSVLYKNLELTFGVVH